MTFDTKLKQVVLTLNKVAHPEGSAEVASVTKELGLQGLVPVTPWMVIEAESVSLLLWKRWYGSTETPHWARLGLMGLPVCPGTEKGGALGEQLRRYGRLAGADINLSASALVEFLGERAIQSNRLRAELVEADALLAQANEEIARHTAKEGSETLP